jgi:hypothetical protein
MRLVGLVAVVALCAVTAVFAACDDSDGGDGTPDAGETPQSVEGGVERLSDAARRYGDATFTAVYALRGGGGDEGDAELTLFKDARTRRRVDIVGEGDGESASLTLIQTADASYVCFANPEDAAPELGVTGDGVCLRSDPENQDTLLEDQFADIESMSETTIVTEVSERQIAGRDAECFTTRDTATAAESQVCFDAEGVLLYSEDDAGAIREATDVQPTVNESDFDLPYAVTEDVPID